MSYAIRSVAPVALQTPPLRHAACILPTTIQQGEAVVTGLQPPVSLRSSRVFSGRLVACRAWPPTGLAVPSAPRVSRPPTGRARRNGSPPAAVRAAVRAASRQRS